MATRMQQRRGTESQWTSANPVLGPGEIGFETDTNKFKIGDGVSRWDELSYFLDETALGGSLDSYVLESTLGVANGVATLDGSGKVPSAQLPDIGELSQDAVNQALTAGTGVTKTYDDAANTLTLGVDTTVIATKQYVDDEIAAIPAPDYTGLATETYVSNAISAIPPVDISGKQDKVAGVSDTEIGYLDGVTSAIQTQLDGKAATSHTHAIADVTNLQTSLDAKAALAGATFTGDVTVETDLIVDGNLTVSGTTTTVSAQDLVVSDPLIYMGEGNNANLVDLGIVASYDDGTYQHTGIVRDSSAGKWKLFKGVTDEPTTTINFAQGSLDDLAVGALEATSATIGDVSNTELQYLNGVTSAIQTQLNGKAATSHTHAIADVTNLQTSLDAKANLAGPTFTGTTTIATGSVTGNLTVAGDLRDTGWTNSRALATDASGNAVTTAVTATELGQLAGVTSAIQTQLNGKAATSHTHAIADVTNLQTSLDGKLSATITNPSSGQVVSYNGSTWVNGSVSVNTNGLVPTTNMYLAVQNNNTNILSSTNGITWQQVAAPFALASDSNISIAYGKGVFLVTLGLTFDARAYRSTDGVTWTIHNANSGEFTAANVAFANGLFVIQDPWFPNTRVSTDGITWVNGYHIDGFESPAWVLKSAGEYFFTYSNGGLFSTRNPINELWTENVPTYGQPAVSDYFGIAWAPNSANGTYVAINASANTNFVATSTDAKTWTNRTLPATQLWTDIAYGNGVFVAVAQSGTSRAATSTDGITWTLRSLPATAFWQRVTWGGNGFVVVSNAGHISTSTDGITWTSRTSPTSSGINAIVSGPTPLRPQVSTGDIERVAIATYTVGEADKWINVTFSGTTTMTLPNPALHLGREITIRTLNGNIVNSASANVLNLSNLTPTTSLIGVSTNNTPFTRSVTLVSDGNLWVAMQGF